MDRVGTGTGAYSLGEPRQIEFRSSIEKRGSPLRSSYKSAFCLIPATSFLRETGRQGFSCFPIGNRGSTEWTDNQRLGI
ncbi:MAG: hypothetical protein DMG42_02910 [Acidobacteria bacterium]|nr:MAG: hypothetical protein DMG42_02910 [Acidobacteriota bacterium]